VTGIRRISLPTFVVFFLFIAASLRGRRRSRNYEPGFGVV